MTVTVHAGIAQGQPHPRLVRPARPERLDECGANDVSVEQLQQLKADCEQVLELVETEQHDLPVSHHRLDRQADRDHDPGAVVTNPAAIEAILPTTAGFFFGGTDYDHWYLEDCKHTIAVVDACLAAHAANKKITFTYQSSW